MTGLGVACARSQRHALRLVARPASCSSSAVASDGVATASGRQRIHSSAVTSYAKPLIHPTVPGPPPKAPVPSASFADERIAKKRQQLELLKKGRQEQSSSGTGKDGKGGATSSLRKRFWKDVRIEDTPDGYQIMLDKRPVRKADKAILTIPHSKPQLATAIALEWDSVVMAAQALKQQYIPLTSLTSRAHDIVEADARAASDSSRGNPTRDAIIAMLMGYLRTDTLLCWAPEKLSYHAYAGHEDPVADGARQSLRQLQEAAAKPIVAHLTSCVWPGVELQPALEAGTILPTPQPAQTQAVVRGWLTGLPAWELAGLERAVLASKSLLVGARLVVEWSGAFRHVRSASGQQRFAVEQAAAACSLETAYQTRSWGEVEDTHDVEREEVRRQLGAAVLLVHDV